MKGRILVGYDDSQHARAALDRGIEEARKVHGKLVVLAVAEMPLDPQTPRNFGTLDDIGPNEGAALQAPPGVVETLAHARQHVESAGVSADYAWAAGEPGAAIVDAAKNLHAGLIVVGDHHHTFLGSLFGADVATAVREHAGCDVIVAG